MNWMDALDKSIKKALNVDGWVRIATHSPVHVGYALAASTRFSLGREANMLLDFSPLPAEEHARYPVGTIIER